MPSPADRGFRMPGEWAPHSRCWMAWPCREALWGEGLAAARDATAEVAKAIAAFEPVTMVANPDSLAEELEYLISYSDARFLVVRDQEQVDKILVIWDGIKDNIEKVIVWDSRGMSHYYGEYFFLERFETVLEIGTEAECRLSRSCSSYLLSTYADCEAGRSVAKASRRAINVTHHGPARAGRRERMSITVQIGKLHSLRWS